MELVYIRKILLRFPNLNVSHPRPIYSKSMHCDSKLSVGSVRALKVDVAILTEVISYFWRVVYVVKARIMTAFVVGDDAHMIEMIMRESFSSFRAESSAS